MKVGQGLTIHKEISYSQKEAKAKELANFQHILTEKQTSVAKEHLNTLLEGITKQGERLVRSQSLKDLHDYKRLIRSFLQEVVKYGLSLEETTSFSPLSSREKKLKVIKEVDKKLLELSEEMIEREDQNIRLLDNIGEIKGLLIDLYL
ncbi:YaaR family protein [Neobacillus soli]|uniref:YaaR family protein n=1 Tax=Neobacillus soli TaxID=220688 RepID=UPI00082672A4|nr:YaaR family protein [Neobacillus soli]